jgi:hypothetical protein
LGQTSLLLLLLLMIMLMIIVMVWLLEEQHLPPLFGILGVREHLGPLDLRE